MKKKYSIWLVYIFGLFLLLIIAVGISLSVGEMKIKITEIFSILSGGDESLEYAVLAKIRLPRIILGIAIGGSLSLAGVLLQGVYRNPLVEPYTLGISGGASLGVAFAIVFGLHRLIGSFVLPLSGFLGAFSIIFIVFALSARKGRVNIQSMLLIGVMISFIASSAMMLLMAITSSENLHGIIFWIMGSLDEPNEMLVYATLIISVISLLISYLFVQPLNALRIGEEKAKHLGVNTDLTIKIIFLISSVLAGVSVAVAGVIGFVGLIIPHLVRLLFGSDYRILLLGSFLAGSVFIVLSDVIARTIISPNELPIGVISGIVGGIVFLFIMGRSRGKNLKNNI